MALVFQRLDGWIITCFLFLGEKEKNRITSSFVVLFIDVEEGKNKTTRVFSWSCF